MMAGEDDVTATAGRGDDARDDVTVESQKSYATILQQEIQEGLDELERPARGLLLSGFSAGLDVGFSLLAIGVVGTLVGEGASELTRALLRANAYALGFTLVIFGRSELFTEHSTIAVLPLLGRRTTVARVARVWGLVYAGNLVGVLVFSTVLAAAASGLGTIDPGVFRGEGARLVGPDGWIQVISGVLAGWLIGLVSWLVTAGRETTSQILFVWIIVGLIGLAGLHHCVLGTAEVLSAVFAGGEISLSDFARFFVCTTLGNVIGGFFFVAVVKYGHASVIRPGLRDWD
ncbi:MAG: formate/nitrite transporter family protein [Myxococcota bacterium]